MKSFKFIFLSLAIAFTLLSQQQVRAQFMPVLYDNVYGSKGKFITACTDFQGGDAVLASTSDGKIVISWVNRLGEDQFSERFNADELSTVNRIIAVSDHSVLVVGSRSVSSKDKDSNTGTAIIISNKGDIIRKVHVGGRAAQITAGELMPNGNLFLSGSTATPTGATAAFICKLSGKDKVAYSYTAAVGETCDWFSVNGGSTEYVTAAFSSGGKGGGSVVRLDNMGKPYFITPIPYTDFKISKMICTDQGDVFLSGESLLSGGVLVKLRSEGDIVFQKQIVPAGASAKLDKLMICGAGDILCGGNDASRAYYALLRPDGTELSSNIDQGQMAAIANNPTNGEWIVSLYSPSQQRGKIIKLSKQGRNLYEKVTAGDYTALRINSNGDLLMGAPKTGRLSMLSNLGDLLFDRYVIENTPQPFEHVYLPANGEVYFAGQNNRIAKLAHGLYVSDIIVTKPINGYSTAKFSVTLSGYSFSSNGSPIPVTVNYITTPLTAQEGLNYTPVSGTLSFVPSSDGNDSYTNKFSVEVPIAANDLLEGDRKFTLALSGVSNSYLIKSSSVATIEDQPAVVRLISTTPGMEGSRDVNYTLGIFKTNGTPLTNATKADIVVDGTYGNGTADKFNFDMGLVPRLVITPNRHSAEFNVKTLENLRYEAKKTVVVDFNKIYSMSDTYITFGSNTLSCTGELYDQPAMIAIESLGDHTKLGGNVMGLFKVSLLRARDGAVMTNCSGSDIVVGVSVDGTSTAKQGTDFVLSNAHDLRIWSDDKSSAVNLNGMVLFSPESGSKNVVVNINSVSSGTDTAKIAIAPNGKTARFAITK